MASQILPVRCGVEIKFSDGSKSKCGRRGNKAHGGLCPKHRKEIERGAA
jgi:hypothetical protein